MDGQTNSSQQMNTPDYAVGNPVGQPEGSGKKKILIILLIVVLLLVLVGGGYYILQSPDLEDADTTPSGVSLSAPTPTPIETIEPEQEEEVDFSEYSVSVLNGTGIAGEAGFLQTELEKLGFEDIDVGNASSTNHTTTLIVFGPDVSSAAQEQLLKALQEVYEEVESEVDEDLTSHDIEITTGLRENQSPAPSPAADDEDDSSPTPSASPSVEE